MDCATNILPTLLKAGLSRHIMHGKGKTVRVLEGHVWITQQGDQRDITLSPGDTFTLDRQGLTLLVAVGQPAVICVDTLPQVTQPADQDLRQTQAANAWRTTWAA